jgi:hypothetical protein
MTRNAVSEAFVLYFESGSINLICSDQVKSDELRQTAYLDETNKLGGRLPSSGARAEQVKLASPWGLGRGAAMIERLNVQRHVVSNVHQ